MQIGFKVSQADDNHRNKGENGLNQLGVWV